MIIIDAKPLITGAEIDFTFPNDSFITDDINEEYLNGTDEALPKNISLIIGKIIDEATYIKNYKVMLNKFKKKSFYNMTGFGDISILAVIETLVHKEKPTLIPEKIIIVTDDSPLSSFISQEFGEVENMEVTNSNKFFGIDLP